MWFAGSACSEVRRPLVGRGQGIRNDRVVCLFIIFHSVFKPRRTCLPRFSPQDTWVLISSGLLPRAYCCVQGRSERTPPAVSAAEMHRASRLVLCLVDDCCPGQRDMIPCLFITPLNLPQLLRIYQLQGIVYLQGKCPAWEH